MKGKLRRLSKEEVRAVDKELEAMVFGASKRLKAAKSIDEKEDVMKEVLSSVLNGSKELGLVRFSRQLEAFLKSL